MFKSLIAFLFKLAKLLKTYGIAEEDMPATLFEMKNSGIDFLLTELLKGDKTTGSLGLDLTKITKFWCFL